MSSIRILVDLRPALEGHAGIPQETRLLFRVLSRIDGITAEGLLQHNSHFLAPGLCDAAGDDACPLAPDRQIDALGRVVISIDQSVHPLSRSERTLTGLHTIAMALRAKMGGTQRLSRFECRYFRDFIWRRLFARTLPPEDMDQVLNHHFRIMQIPSSALHICANVTNRMGGSIYPRLDTRNFDLMIAQTPYPGSVAANTRMLIRYHDAVPLLMPDTIANRTYHHQVHFKALRHNVATGAWFACVSDATRRQLLSVFPQVEERSLTIHNILAHHYFNEEPAAERISDILDARLHTDISPPLDVADIRRRLHALRGPVPLQYVLIVSTIEPRKNHLALLSAWEMLRSTRFPALKLVVAGAPGWHSAEVLDALRPWLDRGEAFLLSDLPAEELRRLYKHARATVCPSFGEGFGFSGVEAMASGGAVVASDIEAHREIYRDGAAFFNPYSVDELVRAIGDLIDPVHGNYRAELCARGQSVAKRYAFDAISPQWQAFLDSGKWRQAA